MWVGEEDDTIIISAIDGTVVVLCGDSNLDHVINPKLFLFFLNTIKILVEDITF